MNRPGDWNCRSCTYLNFSYRDMCQRCGDSRSGESEYGFGRSVPLPGDWFCPASYCGAHNYASRPSCFKCGTVKEESDENAMPTSRGPIGLAAWKAGDWICLRPGCNTHNYASRGECFSCSAPKGYYANNS